MRLLDRFRRSAPTADPADRRQFFRRLSGAGLAVAAASTLGADDAWAAVEERAARFGIVPGTVVDAQGRPVRGAVPPADNSYIGEIFLFAGNFAPRNSAFCQGQLLSISSNTALFSILGTTYGGNGQTTFALPDLQGRAPIGPGQGPGLSSIQLGQPGGTESTTLTTAQMPAHAHSLASGTVAVSNAPGTTPNPTGAIVASPASSIPQFVTTAPTGTLASGSLSGNTSSAGSSQPVGIRDPFLGINFCITLFGIFPPRP